MSVTLTMQPSLLLYTTRPSNVQINRPVTHQTALAEYCNWNQELLSPHEAGEQAIL